MASSIITRRALATEMKKLMESKPFSQISVADICSGCGMNRKSFYYHFIDKYDLVNWIFETECGKPLVEKNYAEFWAFFSELSEYMFENRKFYVSALHIEGDNSFKKTLQEFFEKNFEKYTKTYFESPHTAIVMDKQKECLELLSVTFVASLENWLERHSHVMPNEYLEMARFDKLMEHPVVRR